ncbi:MAG: hypothetical protein KC680_03815 [Candidatus Peregrinibacteria bacterium]|nr:hypothetical protein [Candidatus Peregrinibacteria bacterium]MCB9807791.1 hypothetical protein [Candidatus Peribacteria bacterium]
MSNERKSLIASTGLRQFMFLASHGLRNPLTAIRWSCGRLEKVEEHSEEARVYLEEIAKNTTRLTRILGAIFLLSHLQDQLQPLKYEHLVLHDMLKKSLPKEESDKSILIDGDRTLALESDAEVLHSLFSCILMGCIVAFNGYEPKPIRVQLQGQSDTVSATFLAEAPLQLLRTTPPEKLHTWQGANQLVGGTTGLLLTLSRDLAIAMGGYLKLQEGDHSFTVSVTLPKTRS